MYTTAKELPKPNLYAILSSLLPKMILNRTNFVWQGGPLFSSHPVVYVERNTWSIQVSIECKVAPRPEILKNENAKLFFFVLVFLQRNISYVHLKIQKKKNTEKNTENLQKKIRKIFSVFFSVIFSVFFSVFFSKFKNEALATYYSCLFQ